MSKRFIYYGSFASVQFFSDLFGMPAAAYSLRKLTPSATNCIRVRRSSDNTEQDIGFVANVPNSPIDTTALLAFVGAGNGFVTAWYDQSTNGRNATQSTGGNQPQIVSSGSVNIEGGNATITFNGSSTQLQTTTFTTSLQPITRIAVAKQVFPNWGYIIDGSSTLRGIVGTNNNSSYRIFSGIVSDYNIANSGNQEIRWALFNGSNSELFINNGATLGLVNIGTHGLNMVTIGSSALGNTSQNLLGNVQSVIIYAQNKGSDKSNILTNINNYYNVF